jgi:uncharacterized protein
MRTILITGGNGLIGRALLKRLLVLNDKILILTRNPGKHSRNDAVRFVHWDVGQKMISEPVFAEADHIIHLAGAGIGDKRWTAARKKEILDSRVMSSELLVEFLRSVPNKIRSVIAVSGIGWYGDAGQNHTAFTETDPPANDFIGHTCQEWEKAISGVSALGKRLVILRCGIVLSRDGGALQKMISPLSLGMAAIAGHGNQVISWLHISDLVNIFLLALDNENFKGIYNAVSPQFISFKELILTAARISNGKYFIPVHIPVSILKMRFGEMSGELLKSAPVSANRILDAGFRFNFPSIRSALDDLLRR